MDQILITKKAVRRNKSLRTAQKEARKRYKRVHGPVPHAKISKVITLDKEEAIYIGTEERVFTKSKETYTKEEILNAIKRCQVKGMSGSGFPLIQKLDTLRASNAASYSLIINGAECDPGLLHDEWLTVHKRNEIITGIQFLAKCLPFQEIMLATKLPIHEELGKIKICQVPNRYPIGEEHILAEYLLHRPINKDKLPAEQGILVTNLQTVYSVYQTVITGEPPKDRYLTVANFITGKARVVCAPLHVNALGLLKQVFSNEEDIDAYIGGGALYAHKMTKEDVISEETGLLCYAKEAVFTPLSKCKKCGACVRNCPRNLPIKTLVLAKEHGLPYDASALGLTNCLSCGACSYFCRAGKDLRRLVNDANQEKGEK